MYSYLGWILLFATAIFLNIRFFWLRYKIEDYSFICLYYATKHKKDMKYVGEMSLLWPMSQMLFDAFNWDLYKYVIYPEHYVEALEFLENESKLNDEQFWRELAPQIPANLEEKSEVNDKDRL